MAAASARLFLTLATKFIIKRELAIAQVLEALTLLQKVPFFRGLSCFDTVVWFPQLGRKKSRPAGSSALNELEKMIRTRSVRSFGMVVMQKEHRFRFNEIAFTFPASGRDGDEEVSELQIYIEETEFSDATWQSTREYFERFLKVLMPNYGFSAVHVDAATSEELDAEFQRRLVFQPVDSLNDNRYVWDSDRLIRDVGWLNFLSEGHVSALGPDNLATLRAQPWVMEAFGGIAFGIGDSPLSDYRSVLPGLRSALAAVTCPR